ncbi:hypothetical protein ABZ929_20650 [Streptomyces physcomitrii]|uniref:hypothetical protein n=1 Tax=Streptomyces physcomitrii TaxID=2724184 RepID=UPI00344A9D65
MHMNSVPQHLMNEDRLAYERALDEALHSASYDAGPAAARGLNPEQLRTMALSATALITAAASDEYRRYVQAREDLRRPAPAEEAPAGSAAAREGPGGAAGEGGATGLAAGAAEVVESASAGVLAVVAVLTPMLAGAAAVIFLLVGYLLKAVGPQDGFAKSMLTTGWTFAGLTALAILVAGAGLLFAALRNSADGRPAAQAERLKLAEVERAREDWLDALTHRGILPFLAEAAARPAAAGPAPAPDPASGHRMPQLGYHRPGFSSPGEGEHRTGTGPSYSSPDYSSPDFSGADRQPE